MSFLKDLGRDPAWQRRIARTIASTVGFLERTGRFEFDGDPEAMEYMRATGSAIGAYWHGRMLMMPLVWRTIIRAAGHEHDIKAYSLSTRHRDGVIMGTAVEMLGVGTIWGSQKSGGTDAFREIRARLKEGACVALSVDGGKGPRQRVQGGVMLLAKHAGRPVVPTTWSCRTGRQLDTWDRMLIPAPWSRGIVMAGAPIFVPKDADRDELARLEVVLEVRMNELMAEADRRCGRTPVEPAPARPAAAEAAED